MFALKKVRVVLFLVLLAVISLSIYLFNQSPETKFNEQGGTAYIKYEKAQILKVVAEDLEHNETEKDLYTGTQELEVKILSGEHKGEIHTINNQVNLYVNVVGKVGRKIMVSIDTGSSGDYTIYMFSANRTPYLILIVLLFFGLLWWVGGNKGLKSIFGIIFTLACIIYLFIPMLYRGYSPIFASVLVVILITVVTLLLINGWSPKSLAAILGTAIGVAIAGVIAYGFGNLAHISGYNIELGESLRTISLTTGMQLKGLLFAGILLSTLGAIMDIAISIAASVHEVYLANPKLSKKELFLSGLHVGRDTMGTMANTLILAFTGTSLTSLIILYALKTPFYQLMNLNQITIEVVQGMSGCIGIVLTVPIVAYISSRIIPMSDKNIVVQETTPKKLTYTKHK